MLNVADFLAEPVQWEGNKVRFTLESKASGSLRPDKLLQAIGEGSKSTNGTPLEVVKTTRVAQRAEK